MPNDLAKFKRPRVLGFWSYQKFEINHFKMLYTFSDDHPSITIIGRHRCRAYDLQFNLGQLGQEERIEHAQLRLHVAPSSRKTGHDMAVKVNILGARHLHSGVVLYPMIVSPMLVYGHSNHWISFNLTRYIPKRWRKQQHSVSLRACVENLYGNYMEDYFVLNTTEKEFVPSLVIYSRERKNKNQQLEEASSDKIRREIILRQSWNKRDLIRRNYEFNSRSGMQHSSKYSHSHRHSIPNTDKKHKRKKLNSHPSQNVTSLTLLKSRHEDFLRKSDKEYLRNHRHLKSDDSQLSALSDHMLQGDDPLSDYMLQGDDPSVGLPVRRTPRTLKRNRNDRVRKNKKRGPCTRSPLYVDFKEIEWDSWVIAPKGYQVSHVVSK